MRKYRNIPTTIDGKLFHSKKEAKRYQELKLLQGAGEISGLNCQPVFVIAHNDTLICKVIPDFSYHQGGKYVVEDVKSPITRKEKSYRLKKKLLKAFYDIELVEI